MQTSKDLCPLSDFLIFVVATAEAGCNQLQLQLLQCQSQLADKTAELESVKQQLQNAIDEIETLSDDV